MPYRPLFEAPETTVFQERQNKAQLQYSWVAEGKNCEAQNSNFCVKFCALLSLSYRILSGSSLEKNHGACGTNYAWVEMGVTTHDFLLVTCQYLSSPTLLFVAHAE